MSPRGMRMVLMVLALAGVIAGGTAATRDLGAAVGSEAIEGVPVQPAMAEAPAGDSLAQLIVARDAFRPSRAPAPVPFQPEQPEGAMREPPPPRPNLRLTGIVWGAEPAAILEGVPGSDGPRVMRRGETAGGLNVRRIEQSRVTVTGMDTTWTLSVRDIWQ